MGRFFLYCLFRVYININNRVLAQDTTLLSDTLNVKKNFLHGPMYSFDGNFYIRASLQLQARYNDRFRILFNKNKREFSYLLKSEEHRKISNTLSFFIGAPLGLAVANSIQKEPLWDKKYDKYLLFTSGAFIPLAIYFDFQSFKNLEIAVKLRNNEITDK